MNSFPIPILLIIFNRPDKVQLLIQALEKLGPSRIFVSADGPRPNVDSDIELCEKTRNIINNINWPCEIVRRYQDTNTGCKINASESVSWFFEHVDEGIILEDDCIPTESFFPFCRELLDRYRDETKVMHISGNTFLLPQEVSDKSVSYYFSRCPQLWGWATWKRAWKHYDISMLHLDSIKSDTNVNNLFLRKEHLDYWIKHCQHIRDNNIDTWDAQWQYTMMYHGGYAISPLYNQINNIGFGINATHTKEEINNVSVPTRNFSFPLKHPSHVTADKIADERLMNKFYIRKWWQKLFSKIRKMI